MIDFLRNRLLLLAFAVTYLPTFAQQQIPVSTAVTKSPNELSRASVSDDPDSIAVVKADWQTSRIARGAKLYAHHFSNNNLFSANQHIAYIKVKKSRRAPVFAIGNELKEKKTTATFGIEHHALAAINGTFFDVANGGSVDFVKIDGKVTNINILDKKGMRARHQQAAVVIQNGLIGLRKWDNSPDWESKLSEENVMLSGPMLVYQDRNETLDTTSFTKLRHPRSAIGIKPNGDVILLIADGRQANAAGMSLAELCKTMKWLGCTSAINLDGGGSTTLWISGYGENGVVNFPSDNKKWDHEGSRKVANVILLKPRRK